MSKTALPMLLPLWLAVVVSPNAMALGLGEAELDSFLGKPLNARIPVFSADNLDAEQLNVRLLSVVDAASDSTLSNLESSKIVIRKEIDASGRGVIYLQSQVPLNEPFLNFILQVRWPAGSLQREYTLLLDLPPASPGGGGRTAQSNAPAIEAVSPPNTVANRRPASGLSATPIVDDGDSYITARGDTLWSIAGSLKTLRGGNRNTLMAQIFVLNPQAFIGGNRNLLKERVRLDINAARLAAAVARPPAREEIAQIDVSESAVSEPRPMTSDENSGEQQDNAQATEPQMSTSQSATSSDTESRLSLVGSEIQTVANNISDMTARLALLEERLARLQEQYAQIEGSAVALPVSPTETSDELQPQAVDIAEQESSASVTASAAAAIAESAPDSSVAAARETTAGVNNATVSEGRGWFFGLLFVAVAGLLWFLRRRQEEPEQAPPAVNKGPALQPVSGDDFEDVFTGLSHSWSTGGNGEGAAKVEASLNEQQETIEQNDEPALASEADADSLISIEAANDSDEAFEQPPAKEREAETRAADTEELFIDDDLDFSAFEDEELDLEQLIGASASREDEQWTSSELRTQAAACAKMDDWTGALRLFEKALAADEDNAELKMELLDVYAHLGDVASFESLALQMEFGGASNRTLNEIELLRNTLREQENRLGTKATDFRGK
jgi:pilus assembly protein FimV